MFDDKGYDQPVPSASIIKDQTDMYVKNGKVYENLFYFCLVPADIKYNYIGEYTIDDYRSFSKAVWFKFMLEYDPASR